MPLSAVDIAVIVGYFVLTLAIGLLFSRRAGSSMEEFFVSGRSLPWWIAGTSMVATTFAADTPLAVTGLVAKDGLAGNWFWWAFALGGMLTVFVFARLWRRAEVLTDVELIELRYRGRPAAFLRGFRSLYVALMVNSIVIGWVTGAMLTILQQTVLFDPSGAGSRSDWLWIVLMLVVVGVYSTLSGLWGVALTDMIQFVLAMAGCIALAFVAVDHIGGIDVLQARVADQFGGGGQAFGFLPDFTATDPWMPVGVFFVLLGVHWWAVYYPGAEAGGGGYIVQRMAACKDERHAVGATLWFQLAHYCLRPWPWLLVAFAAMAMHPELRVWATDKLEATNADKGYPMVIRELAPAGLRGLMLVTFFAAFMSTISTQMNWGASYLVNDVYKRFLRPDADERQLAGASRWASVIVLVLGGCAAWLMRDMSVDDAWKFLAALGAGTGAVFVLRWFWWRINAWTEIAAMVSSLVFVYASSSLDWRVEYREALIAAGTIVVWVAVTLITPPEPTDHLVAFYRKVRPGGPGWRRIAALAPDVRPDRDLGRALLATLLGTAVIYLTLPGIGAAIFGEWTTAGVCLGLAAVAGVTLFALAPRTGAAREPSPLR